MPKGDQISVRRKHNLQRKRLGKRNTKGAKKKLKRIAGKEARFRKHENHVISKAIVETAKDTGRGIACEDLSGWSFAQLVSFLSYKARLSGVPVVKVDPRNTSRTCSECGHCEKDNRKSRAKFLCVSCGYRANADQNAALNLRAQGIRKLPLELAGVKAQPESRLL